MIVGLIFWPRAGWREFLFLFIARHSGWIFKSPTAIISQEKYQQPFASNPASI
jgi:hypothetical protein